MSKYEVLSATACPGGTANIMLISFIRLNTLLLSLHCRKYYCAEARYLNILNLHIVGLYSFGAGKYL